MKTILRQKIAAAMVVVMTCGQLQVIPVRAAADGRPEETESPYYEASASDMRMMALGTSGLATPSEASSSDAPWSGDYLYYGTYLQGAKEDGEDGEEAAPLKWRVLSPNSRQGGLQSGAASASNAETVLLMADQVLDKVPYMTAFKPNQSWNDSNLKQWLNDEEKGFYGTAFETEERKAIVSSDGVMVSGSSQASAGEEVMNPPIGGSRMFLLSQAEAAHAGFGFYAPEKMGTGDGDTEDGWAETGEPESASRILKATPRAYSRGADISDDAVSPWWLRSAGSLYGNPDAVFDMEVIDSYGMPDAYEPSSDLPVGVVPAWQLKKEQILFTAPAYGSAIPEASSSNALYEVAARETDEAGNPLPGIEWKAAVADQRHKHFSVEIAGKELPDADDGSYTMRAAPDEILSFTYTGAVAGTDEGPETISAMITDGPGKVLFYGRLKDIETEEDASGEVELQLPDSLLEGNMYRLLLFEEQERGEGRTGYVSPLKSMTLNLKKGRTVQVTDGSILGIASVSDATTSDAMPSDTFPASTSNAAAYEGWLVHVKADEAPEDMGFAEWQTTPVNLKWKKDGQKNADAVFVMPDMDVELKALYRSLASPSDAAVHQEVKPDDWMAYADWADLTPLLEHDDIITPLDRERLGRGWNIDVRLRISREGSGYQEEGFTDAIADELDDGEKVAFYISHSLRKEIANPQGEKRETVLLATASDAVNMTIPVPEKYQDMRDYRLIGHGPEDDGIYLYDITWTENAEGEVEEGLCFRFEGEMNGTYALVYREMMDNHLRIQCRSVVYGEEPEPEVISNDADEEPLFEYKVRDAADDTYTGEIPTAAGKYTVRATVEEYECYRKAVATKDFTIRRKLLADGMLLPVDVQNYTGAVVMPKIRLTDPNGPDGAELIGDGDFQVTYENNINPGTARFTVTATENGNYIGKIKGTFQIKENPDKPVDPDKPVNPDKPGGSGSGGSGGGGGGGSSSFGPKTAATNAGVTGTWVKMADGTWRFTQSGSTEYAANTWIRTGGQWYYFYADGIMATGWLCVNGSWYYLTKEVGSLEGAMKTGWLTDSQDGNTYYLDPVTGAMATGTRLIDGEFYHFTEEGESEPGWLLIPETQQWSFDEKKKSRPVGSLVK